MPAKKNCGAAIGLSIAVWGSGCTELEPEHTQVGATYSTLAVQLQSCASDALACHRAANCDEAAEQACRQGLRACRDTTRDAYRAFHEAVSACLLDKNECVTDAWGDAGLEGDAGSEQLAACRRELLACVEADRPIPPEPDPCMEGLRECVQARVLGGEDDRNAFGDCLGQAHACIVNGLPTCQADGGF
jgi:hypothetical protein